MLLDNQVTSNKKDILPNTKTIKYTEYQIVLTALIQNNNIP